MRLSLLFSLFLGLLAVVTISKRLPFDGVSIEPTAESSAQHLDVTSSTRAAAAPVSAIQSPQTKQPLKVAALAAPAATPGRQRVVQQQGQMYKWRDSSGSIRYQSDPPPSNVQAQVIPFKRKAANKHDETQGQALVLGAASPQSRRAPPLRAAGNLKDAFSEALSVYTPEGFDALIQRVEDIAVKLHERNQTIQSLEKQL